ARNGEIPKFQKPLFGTTPPSALSGLVVQTFLSWGHCPTAASQILQLRLSDGANQDNLTCAGREISTKIQNIKILKMQPSSIKP
ncbi:hypothetical protein, partial [Xanthomonas citri]